MKVPQGLIQWAIPAFALGLIAGVLVDRGAVRHYPGAPFRWSARPGRFGGVPPRFRDRMARDLDLSDAQRARIDTIMQRQVGEFRALQAEMHPRFEAILSHTRVEIDSVLTPDQRDRLRTLYPHRRLPPPPPDSPQGP